MWTRLAGRRCTAPSARPFSKPETWKIAIKVINHYGDEVLKVYRARLNRRPAQVPYDVPYVTVEKTTVYLPAALKKRLRAAARERHVAEAALIREAIQNAIAPRPRFPLFDSGDPTFAHRVDEMLAEGFGLDSLPPKMRKRYDKRGSSGAGTARR